MHEWLVDATRRLAERVGDGAGDYLLTQADVDEVLELARIAAHESGERINAPLLSYLVGVAHGRHGVDLAELVDATVGKPI
jgi:hypothetical protein